MIDSLKFSPEVVDKLGFYVYRLIDPRNSETFYVGVGTGNRVFDHATSISNVDNLDETNLKLRRISEIRQAGLEVHYVIHRHDIPESAVFEVEAALIDAYPGLTNVQGGHHSGSKGPMSVIEINNKYNLPEIYEYPSERLILININNLEDRRDVDNIYRQTMCAWRMDIQKAKQAEFILSVLRGVVIAVFKPEAWHTAKHEYFPNRILPGDDMPDRIGFIGNRADDKIWEKYVGSNGKRVALDSMKHIQNPIRYCNIK